MFSHINPQIAVFLVAMTAGGYAVATVGMKYASAALTPMAFGIILTGLAGAVLGEIILLRQASLTVIYIGIIVFESLMVLAYATYFNGHLNGPQLLGALVALFGFLLVTLAE